MANLKEIRTRIVSISSMSQITNAMKMVSAAKFKRAQDNILQMRPYALKLQEILNTICSNDNSSSDNPYARRGLSQKVLIIVITSNRGLCGAFNSNVIKMTLQIVNEKYSSQLASGNVYFLPVGKKAADFFTKRKYQVIPGIYNNLLDGTTFEKVVPTVQMLIDDFHLGKFGNIEIVYNQFKNAAVQITTNEPFLPVAVESLIKSTDTVKVKAVHHDFIFEPSKEEIIKELIPKMLKIKLLKALLDSVAAEHGARMTAMHKATDNATELVKNLRLQYNKERQASITNEILEIVGGAEALRG